jgi:Domain of unknown function (DUF4440)
MRQYHQKPLEVMSLNCQRFVKSKVNPKTNVATYRKTMKKSFIIFAFIGLSISQLRAQSFEGFYKDYVENMKTDGASYFKKICDPDFIFITGHSGEFYNVNQFFNMVGTSQKMPNYGNEVKKIIELDDLAIVSGISTMPMEKTTYKDAFTYTFRKIDGEWKFAMAHHTKIDYK